MTTLRRVASAALLALTLASCAFVHLTAQDMEKVQQGMTEKEVVEAIGRPTDINRTRAEYGTRAQFVYRQYGTQYESAYVYFEDGLVTSIQY
jgi:outer membrane protein assembly factor BamE (lipoprotein component of BamABCDE complex)